MNIPAFDAAMMALAIFSVAAAFVASTWVNAVSRLSKGRAGRIAAEQPKPGRLLVAIADNPPPFLTAALLIMLVMRVTATVLVTMLLARWGVSAAELIAVVVMTFVLFQFAELAPRTWVLERLDRVLAISARPVWWLGKGLRPLTTLMVKISGFLMLILPGRGLPKGPLTSEEEIKSMLDVAESEEVIEAQEADMIHSIFEFTDTVVREVMVPRPDMVCVPGDAGLEEVLDLTLKKGFSRVPVIGESIDQVLGIVYQKDVVKKLHNGKKTRVRTAAEIARDALFVPESKKVAELLRELQKAKSHMVIVVDEYGGTAGLVTLEDLLEEIVGEIADEYDREEPAVEVLDDHTLRVSARLGIEHLNDLLGSRLPHVQWDSVGGLVGGILGRVAAEGDCVTQDEIRFEVEKVQGRRIAKVLVTTSNGMAASSAEGESSKATGQAVE